MIVIQLLQVLLCEALVRIIWQGVLESSWPAKVHLEVIATKSCLLEDVIGVVFRA